MLHSPATIQCSVYAQVFHGRSPRNKSFWNGTSYFYELCKPLPVSMKEESEIKKKKKDGLSVLPWMRDPVYVGLSDSYPLVSIPFIDHRLVKALNNMGISSLFPVQVAVWHETIGPGFFERDLCINSPTGSGKTLAYALPIVQQLSTRTVKCLRALVVLPSRDLAIQVKDIFDALAPAVGLSVGLAVGQSSITDEISVLIQKPKLDFGLSFDTEDLSPELRSGVDILVATPGRLMDHINNTKGFTLKHLCYLVVDEIDRLLREAYQSWLPTVLKLGYSSNQCPFPLSDTVRLPTFGSLRTIRQFGVERGFKGKPHLRLVKMVLSATLTQDPSKLAQLDLHHPLFLTSGPKRYHLPEQLNSFKVICKPKLKPCYLLALLESFQGEKCIVFTSSVESTHRLCILLNFFGDLQIKIKEYSGLQRQSVRSKTLKAFREGEIQVLIASDAMTRGMDVEGVNNVINYDMPAYIKTYIHRAGRTARAGQTGRCFTLLQKAEFKRFESVLKKAGNESCPIYSVPSESVESYQTHYSLALEKLKETVEAEKHHKRKAVPPNFVLL